EEAVGAPLAVALGPDGVAEALDSAGRVAEREVRRPGLTVDLTLVHPVQPVRVVLASTAGAQLRGFAQGPARGLALAGGGVAARLPGEKGGGQVRRVEPLDALAPRLGGTHGVARVAARVAVDREVGERAGAEAVVGGGVGGAQAREHVGARGVGTPGVEGEPAGLRRGVGGDGGEL